MEARETLRLPPTRDVVRVLERSEVRVRHARVHANRRSAVTTSGGPLQLREVRGRDDVLQLAELLRQPFEESRGFVERQRRAHFRAEHAFDARVIPGIQQLREPIRRHDIALLCLARGLHGLDEQQHHRDQRSRNDFLHGYWFTA